jgi:SAM-dependent methyltransferase
MITNANESFSIVTDCLIRADYKRIQYFPKSRARYLGHEFLLIRSFLLRDNVTLFRQSGLHTVYEQLMRNIYPRLYNLYRVFFQCEEVPLAVFLKFFDHHELDVLIRDGIISCTDGRCICNYRFVPIDDLLIIGSPDCEYDTVNYVYIGGDSIRFWILLKKRWQKSVNDALEIGCGTGFLSLWMSHIAQNVTATDINERALEFTKLNAKINGINNIVTKVSDVYSDIRGEFDLIISNPPFIFLPSECVGRTYAFGEDLGVEILEKILVGLDDHLKDNGTSFLMAMSYIKENGVNTLYEMIKSIFHGKPYSITLKQLDYQLLRNHYSFYKQHGISYSIFYFIKIQKARTYELTHLPIRGGTKLIEYLKIKLLDQPKWKH